MAGTSVDLALYPIDTLKTRLQAPVGFWKAGGFHGIYKGLGAVVIGSAPAAALFFATYEQSKQVLDSCRRGEMTETIPMIRYMDDATIHMIAACAGEVMACLVRVPTEVIKGRLQTSTTHVGLWETVMTVWNEPLTGASVRYQPAGLAGLYRGFGVTLFREIPFATIQFPLYERAKRWWSHHMNHDRGTPPWIAAACGSLSGAVAGALTTPLDVLKTRYMLGQDELGHRYKGIWDVFQRTVQNHGLLALGKGIQPRVFWISLGGFIFFGAYEGSLKIVRPIFD